MNSIPRSHFAEDTLLEYMNDPAALRPGHGERPAPGEVLAVQLADNLDRVTTASRQGLLGQECPLKRSEAGGTRLERITRHLLVVGTDQAAARHGKGSSRADLHRPRVPNRVGPALGPRIGDLAAVEVRRHLRLVGPRVDDRVSTTRVGDAHVQDRAGGAGELRLAVTSRRGLA